MCGMILFIKILFLTSISVSVFSIPLWNNSKHGNPQHVDGDEMMEYTKILKKIAVDGSNSDTTLFYGNSARSLGLKCSACKVALDYALWKFRQPNGSYNGLPEFIDALCKRLEIESNPVCDGIVSAYKPVVGLLKKENYCTTEQLLFVSGADPTARSATDWG